jgi:hypothetical protein
MCAAYKRRRKWWKKGRDMRRLSSEIVLPVEPWETAKIRSKNVK